MSRMFVVLLCVLCAGSSFGQARDSEKLPVSVRKLLNQRFPGWKFADVDEEHRRFIKQEMIGDSPVVIKGDFDGDSRVDHAVLIRHGDLYYERKVVGPRHLLVVFLRRTRGYRVHVIKEPDGQYIVLAKKGTGDYNYDTQKETTYVNDAIMTVIPEKAGSSFVYWKGRFYKFLSAD